jgi:hypothetical protein
VKCTGEIFDAIWTELDEGVRALAATVEPDPSLWERGRPGRWTAGQHVAHVGVILTKTAAAFESAEQALRAGSLPPPPRRGLVQKLVVKMLAESGTMPRGGRAVPAAFPPERPSAQATLDALYRDAERHRVVGARLSAAERDQLWIHNPIRPVWHYRLPEMVRVHAVHARHHRKLIDEIARGR